MTQQDKDSHKTKRFFYTLDGIRGLAAILVAIFHTQPFFGSERFEESYLAVDIFFLLSGVVIANAYEQRLLSGLETWRFALMRVVRIYPLYVLGCMITVLSMVSGIGESTDAKTLLSSLALALFILPGTISEHAFPLNGPSWSLFFEILANIFYAGFVRFLNVRNLIRIMCVSVLGIILGLYLGHTHAIDFGWTLKGWPFGIFRVGYSFFAGVLIYRSFKSGACPVNIHRRQGSFIPITIVALVGVLLTSSPPAALHPYFDSLMVFIIFPAIIYAALFFEPVGIIARVFQFLGTISYAVYALHWPLAYLIRDYLKNLCGILVDDYRPWSGIVLIVSLIIACWLIDKIYDTPVRRFLMSYLK